MVPCMSPVDWIKGSYESKALPLQSVSFPLGFLFSSQFSVAFSDWGRAPSPHLSAISHRSNTHVEKARGFGSWFWRFDPGPAGSSAVGQGPEAEC